MQKNFCCQPKVYNIANTRWFRPIFLRPVCLGLYLATIFAALVGHRLIFICCGSMILAYFGTNFAIFDQYLIKGQCGLPKKLPCGLRATKIGLWAGPHTVLCSHGNGPNPLNKNELQTPAIIRPPRAPWGPLDSGLMNEKMNEGLYSPNF